MKRLVVDTSNLIYRIASARFDAKNQSNNGSPEEMAGLAMHVTLNTLLKYHRQIKPNQIAVAFEGRNNWRKQYTTSDACVSKRLYKGNRVKTSFMDYAFGLVNSFETLVREHTSLICLSANEVEADDLIAGFCQKYKDSKDDETYVLSGDKDFMQLLKYENVRLIHPDKPKPIHPDEIDANYFLFEKCFRGDAGDNVMSAFPRLRATKIKEAFTDDYKKTELFNHEWTIPADDGTNRIVKVGDMWKENKLLMDLEAQPENIRTIIKETVEHGIQNHGTFSFFHFNKFLGQYKLEAIAKQSQLYVDLFSSTHLNSEFKDTQIDNRNLNEQSKEKLKKLRNLIVY